MTEHVAWRTSQAARVAGVVLAVSFAGIGCLAVRNLLQGDGEAAMFLAMLPFVFLAIFRRCWCPQLVLTSDTILVRNAVKRYAVPLTSVVGLEIVRHGIVIDTRNGETVIVSVAQKGLGAELLGRYTRADRIAAELAAAVDEAYRQTGASSPKEVHHAVQQEPPQNQSLVAATFVKWALLGVTLFCLAEFAVGVAVLATDGAFVDQAGTSIYDWTYTLFIADLAAVLATYWLQLRRGTDTE